MRVTLARLDRDTGCFAAARPPILRPTHPSFYGIRVKGLPVYTVVRGRVVMRRGEITGPPIGELQKPIT